MAALRPRCVLCATPIDVQWVLEAGDDDTVTVVVCRACFGRWNEAILDALVGRHPAVATAVPLRPLKSRQTPTP